MPEKITPIYDGKPEDFRWAGFGSGSGTNLRECAKVIKPAVIFSDKPSAKLLKLEELADAHHIIENGFKFCGSFKEAKGNPEALAEYKERSIRFNEFIAQQLHDYEKDHGKLHLIVLGGYMRIVEEPLLNAYPDKIVNVHPAWLDTLDAKHNRIFIGEDAVYDAIEARERKTGSSVILVDSEIDHGEMITKGAGVKVWHEFIDGTLAERAECLREYADAHQSFQKVRSDWPALTTALKLISEGKVALGTTLTHHNEWRTVYVDEKPMPYGGFGVGGEK